ncbi:hypothetical protein [Nesterenkonia flava]|uniref:Methionine synthase n=1 Tax=Nesterenkonia flava TaxID=469799 RepID=A0ABU1FUY1_9MICC|nr:hypothetical protein [Nesterenkonia flava]MDR5712469.1 hypothetical protein [Nesterenkonia flava]
MSDQPTGVRFAAGAVMPGSDPLRAASLLESELAAPHSPALPELPARGHHASLLGRAAAQLTELYAELTSYGWRLVQRPGADHLRARALLRGDVDALADARGTRSEAGLAVAGALSLEMLGPVSLAARLAVPSGEKVLIDHGARRDLAQSLALGAAEHVAHVLRTAGPQRLTVVLLEPDYARVRAGEVATVSGYRSIRALPREETRQLIHAVVGAMRAAGAHEVLLDTGSAVGAEHVEDFFGSSSTTARSAAAASGVDGFGLPLPTLDARDWERAAELVEAGAVLRAGMLSGPSAEAESSLQELPEVSQLVARLGDPWRALGMPPASLESWVLTPWRVADREVTQRLGEVHAMRLVTRVRDAAEALTDHIRSQ